MRIGHGAGKQQQCVPAGQGRSPARSSRLEPDRRSSDIVDHQDGGTFAPQETAFLRLERRHHHPGVQALRDIARVAIPTSRSAGAPLGEFVICQGARGDQ